MMPLIGWMKMLSDRYLTDDVNALPLARELYEVMKQYPILSPHGHIDPKVILENKAFANPVELLVTPDHYITRMLYSQGVSYESLGIPKKDGSSAAVDPKVVWRILADKWHLFRGTPSRIWVQEILYTLFDIDEVLSKENADKLYEVIDSNLKSADFLPQALFNRFKIEVLATTDATADDLSAHKAISGLGLKGRVIPTFRPDDVSDPLRGDFLSAIEKLSAVSGVAITSFGSLLEALRKQRALFKSMGATATDHGVFSAQTLVASDGEKDGLFKQVMQGGADLAVVEKYRAVMLMEHARMSADDGLVMQLHPGSLRNYDKKIFDTYGPDRGFDIPVSLTFTKELQPLLNEVGSSKNFKMVLYTLDEATYSRELAPIAGAYPSVRLGPPWWFLDSLNGMARWRDAVTETAGYYNTVGFIDDTRAFCSVPVRHDVARRFDAGYLAKEVMRHRISKSEALELAVDVAYNLSKDFFNL
jgi:glucuronate isomerase